MTQDPVPPRNRTPSAAESLRAVDASSSVSRLSRNLAQLLRFSPPCRGVALRYNTIAPAGSRLATDTAPRSPVTGRTDGGNESTAVPFGSVIWDHPTGAALGLSAGNGLAGESPGSTRAAIAIPTATRATPVTPNPNRAVRRVMRGSCRAAGPAQPRRRAGPEPMSGSAGGQMLPSPSLGPPL